MERMIEVCAGSYQDCIAAHQGSAKRVELNSALSVGGLTPSVASLIRVKKETDLTVICMVRVRAAGFCYEKEDVEIMFEDAKILTTQPVAYDCPCSKVRMARALGTIKKSDVLEMADIEHGCDITCNFCNESYHFTEEELRAIASKMHD